MKNFLSHPLIVRHPDNLTVNWAQQLVNQHDKNIIVKKVKISSIDIGTTTRIRIKVVHSSPATLPSYWFIKIPSLSWRARAITALPRLLHTETRFYNELAGSTPVTKPTALFANSKLFKGSTLVLNDITEQGGIPGHASDTLTVEQAQLIIEQLAGLHAQFWGETDNNPKYNWLSGPVRQLEDLLGSALAVPLMKRGLNKAGDIVKPTLHQPAIQYARQRRKTMRFLAQGTQTIVHHDCHPGNLFWQNKKPGLLDWQMVRTGEGISDIAYFLATSLDSHTRKANEYQLIKHYIKELSKRGITHLNPKQIHQRYRVHLIYPLEAMLVTLAVGDMMDLAANKTLIKRAASAVEDNNTFIELGF
ncbi:MAG: phosphotransferase [Methylococcales bacterium]